MSVLSLPAPDWRYTLPAHLDDDGDLLVVGARLSDWSPRVDQAVARHLSDDERARADRFEFREDARRHLLGRLMVRRVAGELTGRTPSSLQIETGEHGKPRLAAGGPQFNVSHGGDVVLAVFAAHTPVGIDVEPRERTAGEGGLARSVLVDREFDRWRAIPPERRARWFMHLWTAKESIIKATGEGLARDPTRVVCGFDEGCVTDLAALRSTDAEADPPDPAEWCLRPFDAAGDAVACVTWRGASGDTGRSCRFVGFSLAP
jgi:phosphopantetheine--protein transferase-like protein